MKTQWFEIKALADSEQPVEAFIYDEIGGFGINAKEFIDAIQPYKARAITLRINSPGGSIFDGFAIYNYLRGLNVKTKVDGLAASMASIVALAGKTVEIAENGFFMVHNPAGMVWGTADEIASYAELVAKLEATLANTYQRETGASAKQVKTWMDEETWFTAEEAKAAGLVDEITDAVSLSAKIDTARFKNPPKALAQPIDSAPREEAAKPAATKPPTQMANENQTSLIDTLKALLGIGPAKPEAEPAATTSTTSSAPPVDPAAVLVQAQADLATARQTITTLQAAAATHTTALAAKDKEIADTKASVKAQASMIALGITASQGQPPIEAGPPKSDNPVNGQPGANLTEQCLAANKQETAKK